jgi:alpha-glucosidase
VNLPPGEWYDFWTGSKPANHDHLQLHPRLEELPLYVRAGAILPMQPLVQSTSQTPAGPLKLRVYPGDDCRGSLYMDDGHTYAYQKNELLRIEYTCQLAGNSVTVNGKTVNGAYHPWWSSAEVTVYGAAAAPKEARIGDQIIRDFKYDSQVHSVTLMLSDAVKDWSVRLSY